jgi:hypothetical protein
VLTIARKNSNKFTIIIVLSSDPFSQVRAHMETFCSVFVFLVCLMQVDWVSLGAQELNAKLGKFCCLSRT